SQDDYLLPRGYQTRSFELYGFQPDNGMRFTISDFAADNFASLQLSEIPYNANGGNRKQRRLIEQSRTAFRANDLSGPLPFGKLESMGLLGQTFKLAFTSDVTGEIFRRRREDGSI